MYQNNKGRPWLDEPSFEGVLNSSVRNVVVELASFGAKVHRQNYPAKPRYKPVISRKPPKEDYGRIISKIREPVPEARLQGLKYAQDLPLPPELIPEALILEARLQGFQRKKKRLWIWWTVVVGIIIAGFLIVGNYGFIIKNELIRSGNAGLQNLENAEEDARNFNFASAAEKFSRAYRDFSSAGDRLNFLGSDIGRILAGLPGAGKLKSANNLIELGKILAGTGESISEAITMISRTGSILNPANENPGIIEAVGKALMVSRSNIQKAKLLLADIDESIIPADKRESFENFRSQFSYFEKLVDDGVGFYDFFEGLVDPDGAKKYLLLFQNTSELRPTGGFPGTYGVISFEQGRLKDFFVDDVYNLDGQIKENIVPPRQLQHITPTWGMRDANWFADFPASARKIAEFFKDEAGYGVDGVITVSPAMISQILDLVGPIEMPDYDLTLDGSNFLTTIQNEVEYGENRAQPKQILIDMGPKFIEKLSSAGPDKWLEIFNIILDGVEHKEMVMYFNNLFLESFAMDKGFGGEVKSTAGDYLMVNFSNIKGSKTDAVTDNFIRLETALKGNVALHKLIITRRHNGGSNSYGFYNKQNSSYVRVLLPGNAELTAINGNDLPNFRPLIDYENYRFKTDPDLGKFESGFYSNSDGADIFTESGKAGFGFWMLTDPGTEKTVVLEYEVVLRPGEDYRLYVQKQPGLKVKDFELSFRGIEDREAVSSGLDPSRIGDLHILRGQLDKDVAVKLSPVAR